MEDLPGVAMRLVVLIAAGVLTLGSLTACSDSSSDDISDSGAPAFPPPAVSTPQPTKTPKQKKAATPTPEATVTSTPQPEPSIPSEEFDPDHYDPEGDTPPADATDPGAVTDPSVDTELRDSEDHLNAKCERALRNQAKRAAEDGSSGDLPLPKACR